MSISNNKINFYKFYRLDFCLRNMGIGILGVLSIPYWPDLKLIFIALFQLLLIQMYSFSTNNIYDYEAWDEDNHSGTLLENGWKKEKIFLYSLIPLVVLFFTLLKTGKPSILLLVYILLFHLYQAPGIRLKNHFIPSIIINAVCLGSILYIYPYLAIERSISILPAGFTAVFGIHLIFHEILHQVAHYKRDKIISLPQIAGIESSYRWMTVTLITLVIISLILILIDTTKNRIFLITSLFAVIRIIKLKKMKPTQDNAITLRLSKDKFYTLYECFLYMIMLIAEKIWI